MVTNCSAPLICRERLQASIATSGTSSLEVMVTFNRILYGFFDEFGRDFPWRQMTAPYAILVSEIMLQQTQTERVSVKFNEFMKHFPDINALASATIEEVLAVWQGMGYNRRALYLREVARRIVRDHRGHVPDDPAILVGLPGIGPATAASVCAFAFNRPVVFIETNIRSVIIFFFFPGNTAVTDREIRPLVEHLLDRDDPRKWYSAMMDYGVMLKSTFRKLTRRSAHHVRQSPFSGSDRELRGKILRLFLERKSHHDHDLRKRLDISADRLLFVLDGLVKDGFLKCQDDCYSMVNEEA